MTKLISVLITTIVIVTLSSAVVMLLWNACMVSLFALPVITYWQSVCLYCLTGILFRNSINLDNDKKK